MSVGSKEPTRCGHEEEGVEADAAQLGVEIAKQKPVWENSPSTPECEMRAKKNQAVLEQSANIL